MRNLKKPNRETVLSGDIPDGDGNNNNNAVLPAKSAENHTLTSNKVSDILVRYTILAAAVGSIPIPGGDIVAVSAVQADMVENIAGEYGLHLPKEWVKNLVVALAGSAGLTAGVKIAASSLKAIPFFGTILGGGSSLIASSSTTYAIGLACDRHFRRGGKCDESLIKDIVDDASKIARNYSSRLWKFVQCK